MILKHILFAPTLRRKVKIHLYLPDDYLTSQKTYPVLYLFDGHNLFYDEDATYGRSWRLGEHLDQFGQPMIVVGLECSHEGHNRLMEYAPFPFYDPDFDQAFEARGDRTMQFILHTLKPFIDTHFPTRTDRRHTWIGGSSCGGLMALYAIMAHSSVFSKALVLSPYILVCQSDLLWYASQSSMRRPSSIYFSWGAREGSTGHEFIAQTKVLMDLSNILLKKGVRLEYNVRPFGEHNEAEWESQADSFLRFLLS